MTARGIITSAHYEGSGTSRVVLVFRRHASTRVVHEQAARGHARSFPVPTAHYSDVHATLPIESLPPYVKLSDLTRGEVVATIDDDGAIVSLDYAR
jgi:hypothetical protein